MYIFHETVFEYDILQRPVSELLTTAEGTVKVTETVYGTDPASNSIGQISEIYDQSEKNRFNTFDFYPNYALTHKAG